MNLHLFSFLMECMVSSVTICFIAVNALGQELWSLCCDCLSGFIASVNVYWEILS